MSRNPAEKKPEGFGRGKQRDGWVLFHPDHDGLKNEHVFVR